MAKRLAICGSFGFGAIGVGPIGVGLIGVAGFLATALNAQPPSTQPPDVMMQCLGCHSVEPGRHSVGPSLAGTYGKDAASQDGYEYSYALMDAQLVWDEATLDSYLANPARFVPDGAMNSRVPDASERAAIIAYLKSL